MHRYGQIDLCNLAFHLTFGIGVDTLCMHVFMDAQKNVYSCIYALYCQILSADKCRLYHCLWAGDRSIHGRSVAKDLSRSQS